MSGTVAQTEPDCPRTGYGKAVVAVAGMIVFLAFPVLAQDGTGPVPENAGARNYGGGWDCDVGYEVDGTACVAIDVPDI